MVPGGAMGEGLGGGVGSKTARGGVYPPRFDATWAILEPSGTQLVPLERFWEPFGTRLGPTGEPKTSLSVPSSRKIWKNAVPEGVSEKTRIWGRYLIGKGSPRRWKCMKNHCEHGPGIAWILDNFRKNVLRKNEFSGKGVPMQTTIFMQ